MWRTTSIGSSARTCAYRLARLTSLSCCRGASLPATWSPRPVSLCRSRHRSRHYKRKRKEEAQRSDYPRQFLDELRARIPVSAVVGLRVKLQKAEREDKWKGLSPFDK